MKRSRWLGLVCAALVAGLATVPAHASPTARRQESRPQVAARAPIGAVTLGRVAPTGSSSCADDTLWLQYHSNPAQPTTWVPFDGVITSVSSFANSQPVARIQAVFLRETQNPSTLDIVQRTPVLLLQPSQLNTFPVRIPVQAREVLGIRLVTGGARCVENGAVADSTYIGNSYDGDTTFMPITDTPQMTNISAVWEPDQDGDGYGDVSQDRCPALASAHDPCPAPVTTIKKQPKKRITAHRVKIKFTTDVAGSAFACSIDGRSFKACHSPFKGRFQSGTHTVRVQATSPLGVVGQPVTVQFKVKPKR